MPDTFDQQPQVSPVQQSAMPSEPQPAPAYVPPQVAPVKSPFGPLVIGFFIVIFVAGALAVAYYMSKFKAELAASPAPSVIASPKPSPSIESSATPSASIKGSAKPVVQPTSAIKMTASPTPTATPFSLPSLDVRFGNPSANVKQTVDEGKGDGRVIYREYTSIQAGQFDEVASSWSPKVTVCFHLVANEKVAGKLIKFTMTLDDKVEVEDTMSWIDMLEAGRIYDWCHDVTTGIGKHTARLTINGDKSLKESNYANGVASVTYENLADNVAPNFTLAGPFDWDDKGTCFIIYPPSDNVTPLAQLKTEQKIDAGAWATTAAAEYCFKGTTGNAHSYAYRVSDARGNTSEQSKTFVLY